MSVALSEVAQVQLTTGEASARGGHQDAAAHLEEENFALHGSERNHLAVLHQRHREELILLQLGNLCARGIWVSARTRGSELEAQRGRRASREAVRPTFSFW